MKIPKQVTTSTVKEKGTERFAIWPQKLDLNNFEYQTVLKRSELNFGNHVWKLRMETEQKSQNLRTEFTCDSWDVILEWRFLEWCLL